MTFQTLIGHPIRSWTKTQCFITSLALAGMVLVGDEAAAQSEIKIERHARSPLRLPADGLLSDHVRLAQVVKVFVDSKTNRMTLVGSKKDIAIVAKTIRSIRERMDMKSDPIITEKVLLHSQLADSVALIMQASISVHNSDGAKVQLNAVHFPEAILISGPASAVKRAKELLATIDR